MPSFGVPGGVDSIVIVIFSSSVSTAAPRERWPRVLNCGGCWIVVWACLCAQVDLALIATVRPGFKVRVCSRYPFFFILPCLDSDARFQSIRRSASSCGALLLGKDSSEVVLASSTVPEADRCEAAIAGMAEPTLGHGGCSGSGIMSPCGAYSDRRAAHMVLVNGNDGDGGPLVASVHSMVGADTMLVVPVAEIVTAAPEAAAVVETPTTVPLLWVRQC